MASMRMQMLGSILALLGWVGVLLTCIMPMWRVTAFVGMTIVTSEIMWEGIWMTCIVQSTGYIQCKPYESMLALSTDLKAAQVLTVGSILIGGLGLILAFIGGKCHTDRCWSACGLVPVSWSAIAVVQAFYNPQMTDTQRREIGASIYIGCGASILQFLGGGLLCSSSCDVKAEDESPSVKYVIVRSSRAGSSNGSSQQVKITKLAQSRIPSERSQRSNGESANQKQDKPASAGSKKSGAWTTKSQLPQQSPEKSEGPLTKSQMVHTDSDQKGKIHFTFIVSRWNHFLQAI
uniref:Claudin-4-like n=1 Tax=Pygocentrus nattereri TaxID=42514 RepID=A0AAR2J3U2_PYGNA